MNIAKGFQFTHSTMLDTSWRPGPGEKYSDVPHAVMVVTKVTRDTVYFRPAAAEGRRGTFTLPRDKFLSRYGR